VVVTGFSGSAARPDYATVAYSPGGTRLWARRYNGRGNGSDVARAVAAPGNGRVYVTGVSWGGSVTGDAYVAYNVRTGARLWVRRYHGPAKGVDNAWSLAARGGRVFVTGSSWGGRATWYDYATIAYNR
jgi:dienelactone hydrolase